MANSQRIIDEKTRPEIAQVIIGERMDEMSKDIKSIQKEIKESREPLANLKFLIAGFWGLFVGLVVALFKVFTFKSGNG